MASVMSKSGSSQTLIKVFQTHGLAEFNSFEQLYELHEHYNEVSNRYIKAGQLHYAIKYNPFMGVRSDYFLNEEKDRSETSADGV